MMDVLEIPGELVVMDLAAVLLAMQPEVVVEATREEEQVEDLVLVVEEEVS